MFWLAGQKRGRILTNRAILAFAICVGPTASMGQVCVEVGTSLYFTGDGKFARLEPAFEDYVFMLDDACSARGFTAKDECGIITLMGDVGLNALATYCDDIPVIIYNRELSGIIGGDGAEFVIAHELGHHVCGHVDGPVESFERVRIEELEADRFAGATLRNIGRSLEIALGVTGSLPAEGDDTHPRRFLRMAAIRAGWSNPDSAMECR